MSKVYYISKDTLKHIERNRLKRRLVILVLSAIVGIILGYMAGRVMIAYGALPSQSTEVLRTFAPLVYGKQTVSSAPMALEAYPAPQPLPTACAWPCNIPPIPTPAPINPNCDYDPSPCEG